MLQGSFIVGYTVDQLGGRSVQPGGWLDSQTDDLQEAEDRAAELTAAGCCGYVQRTSDNAVQAPDGTWIVEE